MKSLSDDAIQVTLGASVDGCGLLDFYLDNNRARLPDVSRDNLVFAVAVFRDLADAIESHLAHRLTVQ